MKGMIGCTKSIILHLRWPFMSAHQKYAYLWAKTKKLGDWRYSVRNEAANTGR